MKSAGTQAGPDVVEAADRLLAELLFQEARRRRRRRWWWASAVLAVLILGGLFAGFGGGGTGGGNGKGGALGLPAGGPVASTTRSVDPPPRTALPDVGLTPQGWATVQWGAIQISVPGTWLVDPFGLCGTAKGSVRLGRGGKDGTRCSPPAVNTVVVRSGTNANLTAPELRSEHGLRVTSGVSGTTLVAEALGMTVMAKGPTAAKVLRTITHSPRSVALGNYLQSTPKAWVPVTFAGLTFSVPRSWSQKATDYELGTCSFDGNSVTNAHLWLSTGQKWYGVSCSLHSWDATALAAQSGMAVQGPQNAATTNTDHNCRLLNGVRLCVQPENLANGTLFADVYVPGQSGAVELQIGLSGSGRQALAILDSVHPAT